MVAIISPKPLRAISPFVLSPAMQRQIDAPLSESPSPLAKPRLSSPPRLLSPVNLPEPKVRRTKTRRSGSRRTRRPLEAIADPSARPRYLLPPSASRSTEAKVTPWAWSAPPASTKTGPIRTKKQTRLSRLDPLPSRATPAPACPDDDTPRQLPILPTKVREAMARGDMNLRTPSPRLVVSSPVRFHNLRPVMVQRPARPHTPPQEQRHHADFPDHPPALARPPY